MHGWFVGYPLQSSWLVGGGHLFLSWEVPPEHWDWPWEGVQLPPILGLVVGFEAPWGEFLVVPGWVGLDWQHWWPVGPHFEWPT